MTSHEACAKALFRIWEEESRAHFLEDVMLACSLLMAHAVAHYDKRETMCMKDAERFGR